MAQQNNFKTHNLSHSKTLTSFEECLDAIRHKVISRGDLTYATVSYQLEIITQLCDFSLGRFILEHRGANGFWTDYILSHPNKGRITGKNIDGKPLNMIEDYLLNRCPTVLAHQERFINFRGITQNLLKSGCVIASIPSGVMSDLLTLDFSGLHDVMLYGIDIDLDSLLLAEASGKEKKIMNLKLVREDAWQTSYKNMFDIITSCGLNVYEQDSSKVIQLYKKFFEALKPGGSLVTAILTFPPGESYESDWVTKDLPSQDIILDKLLHKDILDVNWRNFRSLKYLDIEFKAAGFSHIDVVFDKHHIFPTIIAKKNHH